MMKTRFVLMLLPLALSARPLDIRSPNLEPSRGAKPRPPIMVPVGCDKLLSSGCAVSSSDTQVGSEALAVITDGNKECGEGFSVKLAPGLQWVQIDLGKTQAVYAVFIWRSLLLRHLRKDGDAVENRQSLVPVGRACVKATEKLERGTRFPVDDFRCMT